MCFFFFKQKTAYEMRISDWSSDVCSSDLGRGLCAGARGLARPGPGHRAGRGGPPAGWRPAGPLCGTGRDGSPAAGIAGRQPAGDYGRRRVPGRLKERDAMLLAINANNTNTKFGVIDGDRSEEHTSELQSLMRISYAVFCLTNKNHYYQQHKNHIQFN